VFIFLETRKEIAEAHAKLRATLRREFPQRATKDTPRHFEKVRWFARYWNEEIPQKLSLRIRDADRSF
jgi:hypothetical protein